MLSTFSRLGMISVKMWETPLFWHTECSFTVAVRVSKTRVLKVPDVSVYREYTQALLQMTGTSDDCSVRETFDRLLIFIIGQSTDRPPTLDRYSADNQQSTYRPSVGRYIDRHIGRASVDISAEIQVDMSVDISTDARPTPLDRCVDRHIGRASTDISVIFVKVSE